MSPLCISIVRLFIYHHKTTLDVEDTADVGQMHFSHPTARQAAVQTMRWAAVAVNASSGPAFPSTSVTPPNWPALQTWCPTCRSTASWGMPTSRACRADVSSETRDYLMSLVVGHQRTESLSRLERHMLIRFNRLFPTISSLCDVSQLYICGWRPAPGQVSGVGSSFE